MHKNIPFRKTPLYLHDVSDKLSKISKNLQKRGETGAGDRGIMLPKRGKNGNHKYY